MNSLISQDFNREHLALETAKCLKNISENSQNLNLLHKQFLEFNLSLRAYIEESKTCIERLRLDLAHEAKSVYEVVSVLNEKENMSNPIRRCSFDHELYNGGGGGRKRKLLRRINNPREPIAKHDPTQKFISWYSHMIDYERPNLCLYLSDNITLDWFGRTIRTRKKVVAFLKYDMECTRHDFKSVERIDNIQTRDERDQRVESENITDLAAPLSPEEKSMNKRKLSGSPEWENSPETVNVEFVKHKSKRVKLSQAGDVNQKVQNISACDHKNEICDKGDDSTIGTKLKQTSITPTNVERGQGDCIPSTSGTDSDRSHDTLNAQLQKLAVECNGYVEFMRSRNNSFVDTAKWDRKCKVQISYSEDCLNPGEYIIWALCYNDGSKCRRNLMAAFEDALQEDEC